MSRATRAAHSTPPPPYDSFVEKFGESGRRFLDALGIVKIHENEVTLNPILLGVKFKRRTDAVILRKASVTPSGETGKRL